MYEAFYGLREKPFHLLPDPDYLFMSQDHENTYTHLEYAISNNKGFVVITGEIGAGKTTLINYLLTKIQQDIQVGLINNTAVSPTQFIKMICLEFELDVTGMDKVEMLNTFNNFLLEQYASKTRAVLIVDEAQNLPTKTLEEVRMLSNLESEKHHLIQIIMVGQPELTSKIQKRGMEQFAQRVTVHCHLRGVLPAELGPYIRHRLKVAGAKNLDIFDEGAVQAIYDYSQGTPRLVNMLCDTALVYGFADGLKTIQKGLIENIVREREEAGIFVHVRKGQVEPPTDPGESRPTHPIDQRELAEIKNRLASLETKINGNGVNESIVSVDRKLQLFQTMFIHFDRRLKYVNYTVKQRDRAFTQILRLLTENLKSRNYLLNKLLESLGSESALGAVQPKRRSSIFSWFKRSRRNDSTPEQTRRRDRNPVFIK